MADGIMELSDSENSVFLTASGGRVVSVSMMGVLRHEVADGSMELCDSENSVFLTASGGRVVRPCP